MGKWLINDELYHHGIKGQKWGIRRYQNEDGSLTAEGIKRYGIDTTTGRMSEKGMARRLKDAYKTTEKENKELVKEWKKSTWDFKHPGKSQKLADQLNEITKKNMGKKISQEEFDLAVAKANFDDTKLRSIGNVICGSVLATAGAGVTALSAVDSIKFNKAMKEDRIFGEDAKDKLRKSRAMDNLSGAGLGMLGGAVGAGQAALGVHAYNDNKNKLKKARKEYEKKYGTVK